MILLPGNIWQCLETFLADKVRVVLLLLRSKQKPKFTQNIYSAQDSPDSRQQLYVCKCPSPEALKSPFLGSRCMDGLGASTSLSNAQNILKFYLKQFEMKN